MLVEVVVFQFDASGFVLQLCTRPLWPRSACGGASTASYAMEQLSNVPICWISDFKGVPFLHSALIGRRDETRMNLDRIDHLGPLGEELAGEYRRQHSLR